jgi:rRNA maturation endonuclease Nob1
MNIFNKNRIKAMLNGEYVCQKCGCLMKFEDEWEDTLVCDVCGSSTDLKEYGTELSEL